MKKQSFVSPRNIVVTSLLGHSIEFKKGVPNADVPKALYEEVMEKGILPCDDKGNVLDSDTPEMEAIAPEPIKIVLRPKDKVEIDEKVLEVMKILVENNDASDFTAAGMPSARVISRHLGWAVDTKDVRALWLKHAGELKGQ